MDELPNDADGDALRRFLDDGSDLTKPMEIDFHVAVPDQASCQTVARAAEQLGFRTDCVEEDGEDDYEWTCWCTKTMIPHYDDIIAAQKLLDDLSGPHGGYIDGWGSLGNAPEQ